MVSHADAATRDAGSTVSVYLHNGAQPVVVPPADQIVDVSQVPGEPDQG